MANDINIPVNLPGAKEAETDLQKLTAAIKELTEQTKKSAQANTENVVGTDRQAGSFAGLKKVVESVTGELRSMVGAWLGLRGIEKLLDSLAEKMQRIQAIQRQVYEQSLQLQDIGQSLEFQTGTVGQQNQWAQMAIDIQKAGGLKDAATAQQMMISADIAFGTSGGVKSPDIQNLLKQIAPFFGTSQIGSSEIAKVFDFAQTAGIASTPEEWQQYLSQLQAGFTASKATNFGQFMEGLQKGATPYISAGGSFTEAVSLFSGARAVTANEAMAGTLLEQITRLSGGAYERPRKAMEQALGITWSSLSMDQRSAALLKYVDSIPESNRAQWMAEQGFSPELITAVSPVAGTVGADTIQATRSRVLSATPASTMSQQQAYMQSNAGKARQIQADSNRMSLTYGDRGAEFQRRLDRVQLRFSENLLNGKAMSGIPDSYEPYVMLAQELMDDLQAMGPLSGEQEDQRKKLMSEINTYIKRSDWYGNPLRAVYGSSYPATEQGQVQRYFNMYSELNRQANPSAGPTIINNNNVNYYRAPAEPGPRVKPEEI